MPTISGLNQKINFRFHDIKDRTLINNGTAYFKQNSFAKEWFFFLRSKSLSADQEDILGQELRSLFQMMAPS